MAFQNINLTSGDILSAEISQEGYVNSNLSISSIIQNISENYVMSRFRIFVLYPDETVNFELPLEDILSGGSYSENYQNGQRRSLSFSLYNVEGKYNPGINNLWVGTRLRLDVGVQLLDNSIIWFQKGIYVIDKIDPQLNADQSLVQISASDKFSLFENKTGTLESSYEIKEGSNIQEIIENILLTNIGNGTLLDPKPIIYHASFKNKKTLATISKNAGETLGSILNELATQLSAEIFYNSVGRLTIVPFSEIIQDKDKPLLMSYDFNQGEFNNLNFSFDLNSIINRIIVLGNNNNGSVCRAVAVNDNPGSPLCYQRIGYRTGNIINDSNITSDVLAQERAVYELRSQLILKSSTNIEVLFNPFLTVNNLLSISCDFYNLQNSKFIIQSLSFPLDYTGTMSLSISNLENIPILTK